MILAWFSGHYEGIKYAERWCPPCKRRTKRAKQTTAFHKQQTNSRTCKWKKKRKWQYYHTFEWILLKKSTKYFRHFVCEAKALSLLSKCVLAQTLCANCGAPSCLTLAASLLFVAMLTCPISNELSLRLIIAIRVCKITSKNGMRRVKSNHISIILTVDVRGNLWKGSIFTYTLKSNAFHGSLSKRFAKLEGQSSSKKRIARLCDFAPKHLSLFKIHV